MFRLPKSLTFGTAAERAARNCQAIRIAVDCHRAGREATDAEREILAVLMPNTSGIRTAGFWPAANLYAPNPNVAGYLRLPNGTSTDGTAFTTSCTAGRTLVGLSGFANTKLRAVAPLCVAVGRTGGWLDTPTAGTMVGTKSGTAFSQLCPSGSAVSGLRGRSGADVDAIEVECRPLGAKAVLTGDPSYLAAVGGTGGLTKTGSGTLTLSGANTYTGGTTVSAGTLTGTTTSLQGNIVNNAAVAFLAGGAGFSYGGSISGSGGVSVGGTALTTFTGTHSYIGGTTVTSTAGLNIGSSTTTAKIVGALIADGIAAYKK